MKFVPIPCRWMRLGIVDPDNGTIRQAWALLPIRNYGKLAEKQFSEGERYDMEPARPISDRGTVRAGFMARINDDFDRITAEGFENIPEDIAARWLSPTHLRKWLLMQTGFFDEREYEFDKQSEARKLAKDIRIDNPYATIMVRSQVDGKPPTKVIVRRPKSFSDDPDAMPTEEMKAAKKAAIELLESIIGVRRGTLRKEAGRHA